MKNKIVILGVLLSTFLLALLVGPTNSHPATTETTIQQPNLDLIYASYLGGSGDERFSGLALDSNDNIVIAGISSNGFFPVTTNAYNQTRSNDRDAMFVAKLSADGSTLLFSTWIGGLGNDLDLSIFPFGRRHFR